MNGTRRRTRQNSNVFNMLTKQQIMQLRETFNLLDSDGDSRLSVADLSAFLESIGSPFSQEAIEVMVEELKPSCNFMMLLTCIGDKMSEISSEKEIAAWLRIFDEDGDGFVEKSVLRDVLVDEKGGDGISEADFEYLIRGCVEDSMVDCRKLVSRMKHGEIIDGLEKPLVEDVESH